MHLIISLVFPNERTFDRCIIIDSFSGKISSYDIGCIPQFPRMDCFLYTTSYMSGNKYASMKSWSINFVFSNLPFKSYMTSIQGSTTLSIVTSLIFISIGVGFDYFLNAFG
jgi:hypothetical protein